MKLALLGGMTAAEFLRRHWQKKPLFIKGALPAFAGFLEKEALMRLSTQEAVESRLVTYQGAWEVEHGPFRKNRFAKLPAHWSLLVQGVNHFVPEGQKLLANFDFIPHARLDDLMVSFAPDGAGVGPHFDSYDVFLLQGMGRKKWQISAEQDQSLIEDAPLRILKNFVPEEEWILEEGDMLYLPPQYAHNGISLGEAMTYSIGFRAASHREIATEFLNYLQDRCEIEGMYADPDLELQRHPAEIGKPMVEKTLAVLKKISWDEKTVKDFLGAHLSAPKPNLYFSPAKKPLNRERFRAAMKENGLRLDLKSLMLFCDDNFYLNGEAYCGEGADRGILRALADRREIPPQAADPATEELLYGWYLDGFLAPEEK